MKKALALRHIHFEDIGTLHSELFLHGYDLQYIDPSLGGLENLSLEEADLLIVLGGPIGAYDEDIYPFVAEELNVVRKWLDSSRPLLGICLGAQLIARALGAKVYPMGVKEIGFSQLKLSQAGQTSCLSVLEGIPVLHWHGDQFDIPDGAAHLAETLIGRNQAFSFGPNVLGLQFHMEVDSTRIENWLVGHASELSAAKIDPRALREDATRIGGELTLAARAVIAGWLRNLDVR